MGLALAEALPDIHLEVCEKDAAVRAFWEVLTDHSATKELAARVRRHTPTCRSYTRHKNTPLAGAGIIDLAFRALLLNRCSHSGRGGGPIGGWDQQGKWKIDARWNPAKLATKLRETNVLLAGRFRVSDLLAFEYIAAASAETFLYCDPPYIAAGSGLYQHAMTLLEHRQLAILLRARSNWVLSYDDHPEVRRLYAGRCVGILEVLGAAPLGGGRKTTELLIC